MSARERHTLRLHQQVQDKIRSLIEQKKFVCDLVDSYVTEIKSQAVQQLLTEDADQFTEQYVDIMQQLDRCYKTCVLIAASAEDLIECAGSKIPGNQENKGKNEESQRPAFEVKEMSARERHTLRLRQQVQDKIRSLIDQKEFLYDLVDSYFTEAKSQAEHLLLTEDAGEFTDQYVNIMQQLDCCYKTCVLLEASAENLIGDPLTEAWEFICKSYFPWRAGLGANVIKCEVLSRDVTGEEVYEINVIQRTVMPNQLPTRCFYCKRQCPPDEKLKRCTKCFKVGYCNLGCQRNHWQTHRPYCRPSPDPVGCPFIISIPQSRATFSNISKLMEAYARYSVDVFQPPVTNDSILGMSSKPYTSNSSSSWSSGSLDSQSSYGSTCTITAENPEQIVRDIEGDGLESYLIPPGYTDMDIFLSSQPRSFSSTKSSNIQTGEAGHYSPPFFLQPVDHDGVDLTGANGERLEDQGDAALDLSGLHFLSMDWKNDEKIPGYVLVKTKELEVENDESMMTSSLDEVNTAYLSQCLELFTEPEVQVSQDAWYCPQCKEHREATKQMSIWKLPYNLIIQLKRFPFKNLMNKIDKMVEFPVSGLDLSPYYVGTRPANGPPAIYDLYAVVNHHGGALGGHYTAYVRCADPNDYRKNLVGWRLCDDSQVSNISHEKNIVTRAAYLLFYRRREPFILPKRCIPSPESEKIENEEERASDFI